MSNVDEIIKLKELLDKNIITQEEFEKKKKELLNMKDNTEKQSQNTNNSKKSFLSKLGIENNITLTSKKNNNKKKTKLSTIIAALIIVSLICIFANNVDLTSNKYKSENLLATYNISQEDTDKIFSILDDIGYSTYYPNYKLEKSGDNEEIPGSIGFTIKKGQQIVGFIDIKDNNVANIQYSDKILYENGAVQHTLSEYIGNTSSNNERFTLISKEGNKDNYGYITITGEIKNNTNKTYAYAQVTFTLYDESGAQVGTVMDNINDFEANGVWKFKAIGLSNGCTTYKCTGITGW